MSHPILLYDGVCGLCNRFVQFILRRDRKAVFRCASLQSSLAANILAGHGERSTDLDTVYVVVNFDPTEGFSQGLLLGRSDAALFALAQLGGFWSVSAGVIRLLPRFLRDWGYGVIASNRYRIFGRYETCPVPTPATRARFLDQ